MFAVTAGDYRFGNVIDLWEQRAIAVGLTPVIYDLGGLGRGEPFTPPVNALPFLVEKALKDLEGHFVFTTPDALFRGNPTQLVGNWPVAVTVRPKSQWQRHDRIDPGVMYLSDGPDCLEFIKLWWSLTTRFQNDAGRALSVLLSNIQRGGSVSLQSEACPDIKVQAFPTELYNNSDPAGMQRAVIVRAGAGVLDSHKLEWLGLNIDGITRGGVYKTFVNDADFNITRLVQEADAPHVAAEVEPGVYEGHSEAVIVSCFFNPQNNPYRLMAFQKFFRSIKHLNFRIVECVIGPDAKSQLPKHPSITQVYADDLLWHKEALLNMAVADLPPEFKYVFITDTDVLFASPKWMVDGVAALQNVDVIQPFEYCVHLGKNELRPSFDLEAHRGLVSDPAKRHPEMWRSFAANFKDAPGLAESQNFDVHGHTGFAWGFRREILELCPLFDRAVMGGQDHVLAHAVAGQVPCNCTIKAFTVGLDDVLEWSKQMADVTGGKLGYAPGDLYHIWHGKLEHRDYLNQIRMFAGPAKGFEKGPNGLYRLPPQYRKQVNAYYNRREVGYDEFDFIDPTFFEDMGYFIWDLAHLYGPTTYNNETFPVVPPMGEQIMDVPPELPWNVEGAGVLPPPAGQPVELLGGGPVQYRDIPPISSGTDVSWNPDNQGASVSADPVVSQGTDVSGDQGTDVSDMGSTFS